MRAFIRLSVNRAVYGFMLAFLFIGQGLAWGRDKAAGLPFKVIIPTYTQDRDAALAVATQRNAWREAFERRDVDGLMKFYVPDIYSYDLMAAPGVAGQGFAFDGQEAWRQNWVRFFETFGDDLRVTLGDLTVYQAGDMATVRGLTRLRGTLANGHFVDMWTRETNVLRKVNGTWLVIHDHVSVPIDFTTGRALMDLKPVTLP